MNHVYRLIWSHRLNTWVAVSENTRARKKGGARKLVAAALTLSCVVAHAAPGGGQVVAGSGHIGASGNTTTITQQSQNLSLNWQSFNIAPQETVNFVQPSAAAVAVNHIFDTNGTQIFGHLNANGQVYLINPNGVLFGQGAVVNVGALVASSLNPTDANSTTRSFSGTGTGSVVNEGTITAAPGGYVVLMGNHVSNTGTISARLGTVALAAGSGVTLSFDNDDLVSVQVDQSTLNNLAANGGLIQADGGRVIMTAGARDALLASTVNNTGVIEARTVEDHDGEITLLAGMSAGQVSVGGTLDASAPNGGDGGHIETSAAQVSVANDAVVTTAAARGLTGSWLIDPQDFTVAASGGDITGTTLSTELAANNVTLKSSAGATAGSGNVNVNDAVTWSANTILTLTASNNVNVNANITATGATAGLVLNPNTTNGGAAASGTGVFTLPPGASITLSGANPSLSISGQAYTVINSLGAQGSTTGTDLQGIQGNLSGHYALGTDIDASATSGWNGGAGFTPIGTFSGSFNGLGHTIANLTINSGSSSVGLFGDVGAGATIANVGVVGANVSGTSGVGALAGLNYGTISNSYSTGTVSGSFKVGGLVGANYGTVSNSYSTGTVSGSGKVGGLVGLNDGTVSNSYSTGNVSGGYGVGGLVGYNYGSLSSVHSSATVSGSGGGLGGPTSGVGGLVGFAGSNSGFTSSISNSYATGAVTSSGNSPAGGLVGGAYGSITNSYATGAVSGNGMVGGLIGQIGGPNGLPATVSNVYATGAVSASGNQGGGLAGANYGIVTNSYATGAVSGSGTLGGLVATNENGGSVTNGYWDTSTTGQTSSAAGTGLTTAQMQQQSNFSGWDFTGTWTIYDGNTYNTYPLLRTFMTPLTVTANAATQTYNGSAYSGGNGVTYSVTPNGNLLGTLSYGGTSQGAVSAGSGYSITPQGLYSNQQGYLINYVSGTLSVTPAPLTVSGTSVANKVYDGTTGAILSGGTLSSPSGAPITGVTLTLGGGTFTSANVGNNIAVTATDSVSGAGVSNYTFTEPSLSANITPAPLTVSGTSVANKVYDGTLEASLSNGTLFSSTEVPITGVTLTQGGTFASANVGNGIAVTAADSLSGTGSGNYYLSAQPTNLSANITPAPLTVSGTTVANKVYDGSPEASLSKGTLSSSTRVPITGVTLTQGGTFASANVGTGIAVAASDSLSGTGSGNYTLTQPGGLSANITSAPLTVNGTTVTNKVYDGSSEASLSKGTLWSSTDVPITGVTLTQGGTFASANVGNGIAVTASDSLGGAAAGNYALTQPTGLSANITPATLTYIATPEMVTTGKNPKGLTGTVSGFVAGDTLANSTSGSLAWTTNATAASPAGDYAIDGSGLTAKNYVFVQDPNNVFALGEIYPPVPALPEVAWLESVVLPTGFLNSSLPVISSLVASDNSLYLEGKGALVIEDQGVRLPPQAPGTY